MNVSIIIPQYNPDKILLSKIRKSLKKQDFEGETEILELSEGGLACNLNKGVSISKYEIIVTLAQDCVPSNKHWLKNLVKPLNQKNIVASTSRVHLPRSLWGKFDVFAKSLTLKEEGVINPLLDEKGCAYKKKALLKIGGFNEKDFKTAGEDFDTYIKIIKEGKIAYPDSEIIHYHPTDFKKRLKKEMQYANGFGALVRIHKTKMPKWYGGLIKATPIIGLFWYILAYPFKKSFFLFFPYLIAILFAHVLFVFGFWKGFIERRQTI